MGNFFRTSAKPLIAKLLIVLFVVIPVALLINYYAEKKAVENLRILEREFNIIEPFSTLVLTNYCTHNRASIALVTAKYVTTSNSGLIFEYYKSKLSENGWVYCCPLQYDNTKEILFKKRELTAYISYTNGIKKSLEVSFSLGMGGCQLDCKD